MALLEIENLCVDFGSEARPFRAVDGVSFTLERGEVLGIVGESGSGKSVSSLALMGLIDFPGRVRADRLRFDGEDLLALSGRARRRLVGKDIAMVFQDPLSSLNPVIPVGLQVTEVLERHRGIKRKDAMPMAADLLKRVGIPDPNRRIKDYPHQMSGGMRQRALIAIALACAPRLLIADEPTTALDVTIQAQILALLKELVEDTGTALIMITHDLGVVAGLCDEVNVLYGGRIVERGDRHPIFREPRHPYTNGLLGSIPRLDTVGERLTPIPGSVADNLPWDHACAFAPRCSQPVEVCTTNTPTLEESGRRALRCFNPVEVAR